jgi:predicted phage-related endonuclease
MQRHDYPQGSPQWHAHRAQSRNASDAPAVLGCSSYTTRQQLLHAKHTGIQPEVSADLQRRFDDGHAIEAAQRPGAEEVIGDDLFPVVGSAVVDGIELSASFDGLTMLEDTVYECKSLNANLREAMPAEGCSETAGRDLPKMYRVQMEQQLAVSGAGRVLFVAANRDGSEVRRCWYYPDLALRTEIVGAWKQFDADLVAYVPPAASSVERIVAEPVEALPAPVVRVSGQLTLTDNFKVFEQRLHHFLEHKLIREPKSDQDFADLDGQIKEMKRAREALASAEAQMLAQVQPVDQAKKTKDMLDKLLQQNLSLAERLLKDEKERRRGDIVAAGGKALADHLAALNKRLGKPYMPAVPADFGGCIRGLKSLASMEDKVSTELARAKIAANEIADRIQENLDALRELASEHAFLFADTATLVQKAPDDCRVVITSRISEHKAAEERRLEAERTRIRAEEEARAQRQQQEREAAERRQREETEAAARRQEQERLHREEQQRQQSAAPAPALQTVQPTLVPTAPAPADVVPIRRAAAPAAQPTLRLGEIQRRIAPLSVDAAGLAGLGFPVVKSEGAAKLWHEHQFPAICDALITHLTAARDQRQAA